MNDQLYEREQLLVAAKNGAKQSSCWLLRGPSVAAVIMIFLAVALSTEQFTAKLLGRLLLGIGGLATLLSVSGVRWILTDKIHRSFVPRIERIYRRFETIPGDDREWHAEVISMLLSLREAVFAGFAVTAGVLTGWAAALQLIDHQAPPGLAIVLGILVLVAIYLVAIRLADRMLRVMLIPCEIRHLF